LLGIKLNALSSCDFLPVQNRRIAHFWQSSSPLRSRRARSFEKKNPNLFFFVLFVSFVVNLGLLFAAL